MWSVGWLWLGMWALELGYRVHCWAWRWGLSALVNSSIRGVHSMGSGSLVARLDGAGGPGRGLWVGLRFLLPWVGGGRGGRQWLLGLNLGIVVSAVALCRVRFVVWAARTPEDLDGRCPGSVFRYLGVA